LMIPVLLAIFFACKPTTRAPECKPEFASTKLHGMDLRDHKAFDRLDAMLGRGQPVWDAYDALLKLDPDNTLLKVRAAWAMEYLGPAGKGHSAANNLLKELLKRHPNDKDVQFLDAALSVESAARSGDPTALNKAAAKVNTFTKAHPHYVGPHGVTTNDMAKALTNSIKGKTQ